MKNILRLLKSELIMNSNIFNRRNIMEIKIRCSWLFVLVQLVLLILKVSKVINWSYWLVFLPSIIYAILTLATLIIALILILK